MSENLKLNIKYALINVFYFFLVCGALGYANNFLKASGFKTSTIGIVLTLVSITALVGQTFAAPIIDRSKTITEKKFIIGTLVVASVLFVLMLILPAGNAALIPICVVGFACSSMGMPFLNALAFAYEQEGGKINYGVSRGVGSAAYAVAGIVIGWLLGWQGGKEDAILRILPTFLLVSAILTALAVNTMKDPIKVEHTASGEPVKQISYIGFFKKYSNILLVLAAIMLIMFGHMLINNFMIDILAKIGGDATVQGNAIFLQAMVELPPMFLFAMILKKIKVDYLLAFAAVVYVIKHALIAFAPNVGVYYCAMALQMLSYAILIPGSVYFIAEHVDAEDRNKGQAIAGATSTVGGLLASFVGGMLLEKLGVDTVLIIILVATVAGAALMILAVRNLNQKPVAEPQPVTVPEEPVEEPEPVTVPEEPVAEPVETTTEE